MRQGKMEDLLAPTRVTRRSTGLQLNEYSDGSMDVTCCFGHIYHDLDPTTLKLNERQCGVLRKLIEQNVFVTDICAQMKKEYPPMNRLHYTSQNDVRNLAIRLGLSIRIGRKKTLRRSTNYNDEEYAENLLNEKGSTVISDGYPALHSYPVDEYDIETNDRSDEDSHMFEDFSSSLWKPPVQSSVSLDYTESGRPPRVKRLPRRFMDDSTRIKHK
ncbi:unnamed protein product [Angiostrongylus costaricensis]|uniref:Methyltransf_11 domain-containing protein n=1 Tax=Angiostrongylus costaricensis TaxID=334426 RepID=A0A0R3PL88_ANGCS|nr:unnamed protein product [Angiostrongylus costaricensis]